MWAEREMGNTKKNTATLIEGKHQLMLLDQIFLFSMFFPLVFGNNTFIHSVNRNKT